MVDAKSGLDRALGLPALIAYGMGGMLGGGIYALVGSVAAVAQDRAAYCFLLAMLVATPTALSYASLSSRYPNSAGEAWYCERAFRRQEIALLVGWLVLASGVTSMGTLASAFAGYLRGLVPAAPRPALEVAFLLGLAGINWRGIRFSSAFNIACTAIELGGLVLVIVVGAAYLAPEGSVATSTATSSAPSSASLAALFQGAALAFYAFIGFEDMVKLAEEVKRPRRNMPIAILTGLVAVGIVYFAVTAISIAVVTPSELASSRQPLVEVVERGAPQIPREVFTFVALFALANSALLNFIMASRLTYGMARQGLVPAWFHHVHPVRRTPTRAITVVFLVASTLALSGTVSVLAGATSLLLLVVFAAINVALTKLQKRVEVSEPARTATSELLETSLDERERWFSAPHWVPYVGIVFSLVLMAFTPTSSLIAASPLLALGLILILAFRWRGR